jgi:hypothetical protein
MAVVAALGVWSCGGSHENPTAPVLVQETENPATPVAAQDAGDEGEGSVTSSCRHRKVTICYKGRTMKVSFLELFFYLRHRARLGPCAPPAATCPCFSAEGLAEVAQNCPVAPNASCPSTYSISLYCAPSGGGGTVSPLGYFEALLDSGTCSTVTLDPSGNEVVSPPQAVTPEQFQACRQAIVGNPYYPGSCPR